MIKTKAMPRNKYLSRINTVLWPQPRSAERTEDARSGTGLYCFPQIIAIPNNKKAANIKCN